MLNITKSDRVIKIKRFFYQFKISTNLTVNIYNNNNWYYILHDI